MAKKVILKDDNVEIMPITRGELVLDSSGQLAFHSSQFLATQSLPGLMSEEDKTKLDSLEKVIAEDKKVEQVNTTTNSNYRILFSNSADNETKTEGARKSAKLQFNPYTGALTATALIGKLDWSNLNGVPDDFTPAQHIHNTHEIKALTNYSKASSASDLATTDTLNIALGKLEYKADAAYIWYKSITETDTDDIINKWSEVVDFVNNLEDDILDTFVTINTKQTITGEKTFSGTSASLLTIDRNSTNPAWIRFMKNGTLLGYLGVSNDNKALFNNGSNTYDILHSGNSYIKNGVITINGANITPITSHQSLANYVTLNGKQDITGEKTFKVQQKFTVAQGTSPFTVTSTTTVANLSAALLDGTSKEGLFTELANVNDSTNPNSIKVTVGGTTKYLKVDYAELANKVVCNASTSDQDRPILVTNLSNGIYYTKKVKLNYSTGNVTAPTFTGDLIGNANSATTASRLSTVSKTAWGLTYWTSGGVPTNISGDMTNVGNITITSNGNVDRFITFDTASTRSWRIGYLGTGSGDANYLTFQSTKTSTAADGWYDMLKIGCETGNAILTGQLTAKNFVSGDGISDFSAGTVKLEVLNIPTSKEGTTFGPGSDGQVLKSNGATVYWASDSNSNSWRAIQVNGTQIAGTGTNTYALNFVSGTGITVAGTSGSSSASNSITITNAGVRSVTIGTGSNSNKVAVNTNGTPTYLTIPYATTSKSLANYYSSRPTTIDPGVTGDGSMFQFKCTSSVTDTTTDPGDGHILHFNWDNNGKWDSQIYLNCGGTSLKTRGMDGSGWNSWVTYLNTSNYTSYLGYIGTTSVQSSSAALALTGITNATMSGTTTTKNLVISGANQYREAGGILLTNSDIWGVNAIYTADSAGGANEGYQFVRSDANYDSIWCSDGTFYFSPNGHPTNGYSTNHTVLHSGNSSVSGGGSDWGSSITVKINGTSKTLTIPANPNTDYKVTQTVTTTSNTSWRPIILGQSYSNASPFAPSTVTDSVLASHLLKVKPSTGDLWLNGSIEASGGTIAGTLTIKRNASAIRYITTDGTVWGWLGFNAKDTPVAYMGNGTTVYNLLHSGNSSVSGGGSSWGSSISVKINGTTSTLTIPSNPNTWRPITNSYSGTATDTSLSLKGANDLYNALLNGYASSSGYISGGSISNLNSPTTWSSDGGRLVYDLYSGSASNKPVSLDNANGIITLFKGKHGTTGQYVTQIAAPDNGRLYVRYSLGGTWLGWSTVAFTSDIPSIPSITATTTGSGNAITSVSASGHTITFTKGSTFLTSHLSLANCLRSTAWVNNPGQDANNMTNNTMNFTYGNNAPYTGPIIYFAGASGGTYGMLMNATYNGGGYNLAFRTRNGDNGTWNSWHRLARAAEIPTKTSLLTNDSGFLTSRGYWANVAVSGSSSTSTHPTFANMTSSGRIYAGEWIEFSKNTGLYWPNTYGAHFYPNNTSTYGQFKLLGSKGDYSGILFGSSTSFLTVMSTATHHGLYHEGGGIWEFYYNSSSKGVGIRTSTITKNFNVSGLSYLSSNTWIGTTSGSEMLNVGGWVGTVGNTGWYSVTHTGGWYMIDSTYVRVYNNKSIYTTGNSYVTSYYSKDIAVLGFCTKAGDWTGGAANSTVVGANYQTHIRSSSDNLYHYHWTNGANYKILDANNWSSVTGLGTSWESGGSVYCYGVRSGSYLYFRRFKAGGYYIVYMYGTFSASTYADKDGGDAFYTSSAKSTKSQVPSGYRPLNGVAFAPWTGASGNENNRGFSLYVNTSGYIYYQGHASMPSAMGGTSVNINYLYISAG